MKVFLLIALLLFSVGCGNTNILGAFADEETDEALLFKAKMQVNEQKYSEAIATLDSMTAEFLAQRNVQVLYASAYAGRCGLNLLDLVESVADLGSTLVLRFLMGEYPGAAAANITDCQTAINTIVGIDDDADNRTADENIFLTFLSMTMMGVILSTDADTDDNKVPDAGFNGCSDASLSDSNAQWVGYSIALISQSLSAVSSSVGDDVASAVTGACSAMATAAPSYNFCNATAPTGITGDQLKGVRTLVQENELLGIGSCDDTLVNCVCP